MKPETLRKLSALGLSVEQIAGVMEVMSEDAEEGKEKARERWRRWKAKQPTNVGKRLQTDANVSKQLARVEDSSSRLDISGEDKKDDTSPAAQPKSKATRIPENFVPDEAWAIGQGLTPDQAHREASQFVDFWRAKSGAGATKRDWPATWRVWVRNSDKRRPSTNGHGPPTHAEKVNAALDRIINGKSHEHPTNSAGNERGDVRSSEIPLRLVAITPRH